MRVENKGGEDPDTGNRPKNRQMSQAQISLSHTRRRATNAQYRRRTPRIPRPLTSPTSPKPGGDRAASNGIWTGYASANGGRFAGLHRVSKAVAPSGSDRGARRTWARISVGFRRCAAFGNPCGQFRCIHFGRHDAATAPRAERPQNGSGSLGPSNQSRLLPRLTAG